MIQKHIFIPANEKSTNRTDSRWPTKIRKRHFWIKNKIEKEIILFKCRSV